MNSSRTRSAPWLAILLAAAAHPPHAAAATLKTLYAFPGTEAPSGGFAAGPNGVFYGPVHGTSDNGAIIELAPDPAKAGKFIETVLHPFAGGSTDGAGPNGVLLGAGGTLYGTTTRGGPAAADCSAGCGTVFQLTPPATKSTAWTETILHVFPGGAGGYLPGGDLALDAKGRLYGVTVQGGSTACGTFGCGTLFRLIAPKSGTGAWTATPLKLSAKEGPEPAGISVDAAGNFYVTSMLGGGTAPGATDHRPGAGQGCGRVFILTMYGYLELKPDNPAYEFVCATEGAKFAAHGEYPAAPATPLGGTLPAPAAATTLLGTTAGGGYASECPEFGNNGCGVVYAVVKGANGKWAEQVLYRFKNLADGAAPSGTLVQDSAGNIYGTTLGGGTVSDSCQSGCGTVFELSPPPAGTGEWKKVFEHKFKYPGSNGAAPSANLIAAGGAIYGTTTEGGDPKACGGFGCGTLFEITP